MAKQHINYETVSNPAMLERILNHLDEEIDEIRVLVNELKADVAVDGTNYNDTMDRIKAMVANQVVGDTMPEMSCKKATNSTAIFLPDAYSYFIDGSKLTKDNSSVMELSTATSVLTVSASSYYNKAIMAIDEDGSTAIFPGIEAKTAGSVTLPDSVPNDVCILGIVTVKTNASSFLGGTSKHSGDFSVTTDVTKKFRPEHYYTQSDPSISADSVVEKVVRGK